MFFFLQMCCGRPLQVRDISGHWIDNMSVLNCERLHSLTNLYHYPGIALSDFSSSKGPWDNHQVIDNVYQKFNKSVGKMTSACFHHHSATQFRIYL